EPFGSDAETHTDCGRDQVDHFRIGVDEIGIFHRENALGDKSAGEVAQGNARNKPTHLRPPKIRLIKAMRMERRLVLGVTIGSSSVRGDPSIAMPSAFLRTSSTRLDQPLPKASHVERPRRKAMRPSQTALITVIGWASRAAASVTGP